MNEPGLAGASWAALVTGYVTANIDVLLHRGALAVAIISGCLAIYAHFFRKPKK